MLKSGNGIDELGEIGSEAQKISNCVHEHFLFSVPIGVELSLCSVT